MKFSAWYGILVGLLMIGQRTVSIASGGVPEFETAPVAIAFHLAAELSTALLLIAGGIGALQSRVWGKRTLLVGLGMVIYSEVVSPGYFAQRGQWAFVLILMTLLGGALVSAVLLCMKQDKLDPT